jgi:hypothetical protein
LSILRNFKPGNTTTITVFRRGQTIELTITLGERPAPADSQTLQPIKPTEPADQETVPEGYNWYDYFFGFGG